MKHILEQIKAGETKSGISKQGKPYTSTPVGLKIKGEWHNSLVFGDKMEVVRAWGKAQEVDIELFEEEYNGKVYKKWRFPKSSGSALSGVALEKLERIEKAVEIIYRKLDDIYEQLKKRI